MADGGKGRKGPTIGVLGAAAAILSIWWFALRPRRHRADDPTVVSVEELDD